MITDLWDELSDGMKAVIVVWIWMLTILLGAVLALHGHWILASLCGLLLFSHLVYLAAENW